MQLVLLLKVGTFANQYWSQGLSVRELEACLPYCIILLAKLDMPAIFSLLIHFIFDHKSVDHLNIFVSIQPVCL